MRGNELGMPQSKGRIANRWRNCAARFFGTQQMFGLITGQNPQSSEDVAKEVLKALAE